MYMFTQKQIFEGNSGVFVDLEYTLYVVIRLPWIGCRNLLIKAMQKHNINMQDGI